jgi:hypothetical protein
MIDWLYDFFGWCRKHKVRTEWDGAQQLYVCPIHEREAYATFTNTNGVNSRPSATPSA